MLSTETGAAKPDPEVSAVARRRQFSAEYKRSFLQEYEASPKGERGALLRREGLYTWHVVAWRKQRAERYASVASWDGDGHVMDESEVPRWRFARSASAGFSLTGTDGSKVLTILRETLYPRRRFAVHDDGQRIGTVRELNLLFTRYSIEFEDGLTCALRLPLFTVHFSGESTAGQSIRIEMQDHLVWRIALDPGLDDARLIGALAFLHTQRSRQ